MEVSAREPESHTGTDTGDQTKRTTFTVRRAIEYVGFFLGVVGLLFAINEYHEGEKTKATLEDVAQDAHAAVEAASTAFVDEFPHNLPEIKAVIASTCQNLDIMTDVAGYGMYSNFDDFQPYFLTIAELASTKVEDRRRQESDKRSDKRQRNVCAGIPAVGDQHNNVLVRMLVYNGKTLKDAIKNQFKRETYQEILSKPQFDQFFARNKNLPKPKTYDEFVADLVQTQRNYASDLGDHHNVQIRYAERRYEIYIWTHDHQEAAFSLDYLGDIKGKSEKEITFRSRDGKLLRAFDDIFELEWGKAKEHFD